MFNNITNVILSEVEGSAADRRSFDFAQDDMEPGTSGLEPFRFVHGSI
jgi:hypothetical protein